jgi:hypothetical protein
LKAINVPVPSLEIANLGAGLNGQFLFTTWSLKINTSMAIGNAQQIQNPNHRKEIIAKLGDCITHESRHCEQWWRMIRLHVADLRAKGIKPTAQVLSGKFSGVTNDVLTKIIASLAMSPLEAGETRPWLESVYGGGSSFREVNLYGRNLKRTGGKFASVGEQFQNSEFARYERGLAEEEDAHQIGQMIQQLYLQGSGIPPQELVGHKPVSHGVMHY